MRWKEAKEKRKMQSIGERGSLTLVAQFDNGMKKCSCYRKWCIFIKWNIAILRREREGERETEVADLWSWCKLCESSCGCVHCLELVPLAIILFETERKQAHTQCLCFPPFPAKSKSGHFSSISTPYHLMQRSEKFEIPSGLPGVVV